MLRSLLAPAALLIALALPAAAPAREVVLYDVHIDANVSYDHVKHAENSGGGSWKEVVDEEWHFSGKVTSDLPMVSFVDGELQPYGTGGLLEEDVAGRYTRHEEDTWTGPSSLTCDSDTNPTPGGRAGIDPVLVDGGYEGIGVRVVDTLTVTGNCDDGRSPGSTILAVFSEDEEIALDAFDARFDIPADEVGSGQIAHLVSGGAAGHECPGFESGVTQSCQAKFDGVVTFTRHDLAGDVDPVEQLPAPNPGPPTNPYDPIKAVQDAIREQQERDQRNEEELIDNVRDAIEDYLDTERIADSIKDAFQQHSNSARVELTCPGACSGSVNATAQGTSLATAAFRPVAAPRAAAGAAPAPRKMVARLRFDRRDHRRVRRSGAVTLKVAVRVGGGPLQRKTIKVKTARRRS